MRLTLCLILTTLAGSVAAQDRAAVLIGSYHVGADRGDFNEFNPGLFLTWDDVTVGAYLNSYGDHSVSVTYEWAIHANVDIFVGVATYDDLMPIGGLQFHKGPFFAQIIPSNGDPVDAIVTFGLTSNLGE